MLEPRPSKPQHGASRVYFNDSNDTSREFPSSFLYRSLCTGEERFVERIGKNRMNLRLLRGHFTTFEREIKSCERKAFARHARVKTSEQASWAGC